MPRHKTTRPGTAMDGSSSVPATDPHRWLQSYAAARDLEERKRLLVQIAHETVGILRTGCYRSPANGEVVELPRRAMAAAQQRTRMYPGRLRQADVEQLPRFEPSAAEVWNCDTVEAGRRLHQRGHTPALLNMANAVHAGGGFWSGAHAQEEDLHRRSDLCEHLEHQIKGGYLRYPIPDCGAVFSPGVHFFRDERDRGYQPLPQADSHSFVVLSAAAYNLKSGRTREWLSRSGSGGFDANYATRMKDKIRSLLRVGRYGDEHCFAEQRSVDSIVLGAWGCGAFGNAPAVVASFFAEVMAEPSLQGLYRKVVFAILDDGNAGDAPPPCRSAHARLKSACTFFF